MAPKQEEDIQQHQLFYTRCTVGRRVFNLVIDSESIENIIGRQVVNQLQIPVEQHPNPYTIGWIKATKRIDVQEKCKVPFLLENIKMRSIAT